MSTRYARLRPQMTADEAISYLRRQARAKLETIYVAYVARHRAAPARRRVVPRSVRGRADKTVAEIMETDVVRVTDEMDQETVSRIFAEHDLNVVPVVDSDGKMKGIVTVDDIVDVVQEEATEDIQKFGGMEALDMPYLASSRREMIKKRARWLTILLIGEMLTATALGFFQDELDKAIVLSLFLPLIISSGGNSGSQASTLVIRAMALGEVRVADWWRVFRREIAIGRRARRDPRQRRGAPRDRVGRRRRLRRLGRRALRADRPHRRDQPRRLRAVGHADGRDAAVRAAQGSAPIPRARRRRSSRRWSTSAASSSTSRSRARS